MRPRDQSLDAVSDILSRLSAGDDCGPLGMLAARHGEGLRNSTGVQIFAAVVAARGRASVSDYSRLVGCAERTLQVTHSRLRLVQPLMVLRWAKTLWLAWRIEVLGMALKQARHVSGESYASLGTAVRSITSMTPSSLARRAAFDLVCSRLPDLLSNANHARGSLRK
jgi:hypothetical protein